jgi:hypothetical protein
MTNEETQEREVQSPAELAAEAREMVADWSEAMAEMRAAHGELSEAVAKMRAQLTATGKERLAEAFEEQQAPKKRAAEAQAANTDQARLDRLAAGTATPEDKLWYRRRYGGGAG